MKTVTALITFASLASIALMGCNPNADSTREYNAPPGSSQRQAGQQGYHPYQEYQGYMANPQPSQQPQVNPSPPSVIAH